MARENEQKRAASVPDALGGWSPTQVSWACKDLEGSADARGGEPFERGVAKALRRVAAALREGEVRILEGDAKPKKATDAGVSELTPQGAAGLVDTTLAAAWRAQSKVAGEPEKAALWRGMRSGYVEAFAFLRTGTLPGPVEVTEPALGALSFGVDLDELRDSLDQVVREHVHGSRREESASAVAVDGTQSDGGGPS